MTLTHYIVVRRDLPVGVLLAMVAHAAGESFYRLASTFTVASFNPSETIAIVLGARNEGRLEKLAHALHADSVPCVEIHEVDGEYAGQLLAIGIVPGDKSALAPFVRDFHMLKELQP
jgi:hypothetical protein